MLNIIIVWVTTNHFIAEVAGLIFGVTCIRIS